MTRTRMLVVSLLLITLTACIAKQSGAAINPNGPGFLAGVGHGFIFPVAWIVSLFTDQIAVYAVPNNGGWYNFGYFIGVCVLGVGARSSKRR